MLIKSPSVYLLAVLCVTIVTPAQALVQRAFVASYGDDVNTATDCQVLAPCRRYSAAVTVVNPNGEVVAIDSASYGNVTLTQSVSLTAAPGIYAGTSAFPGLIGITIATADVSVVLRGLTINGQGGPYGILMTNGAKLSIENCVISNFSGNEQYAVYVDTAARVTMVNTLVRDNFVGINLQGGANADISESRFLGNGIGIVAKSTANKSTTAAISDTVVTGSFDGVSAFSGSSGNSRINAVRSTITNSSNIGIAAFASAGTATITFSDSMVTGNTIGYLQVNGGGTATLKSLRNNIITDNGSNTGTLTTLLPQ
ncbi:MAG: hypothetical protein DID91_2727704044 [Candidatus Nitrotoga sp. MKT]|nr:MAG: hypothetical protein DID91_2727704044 [Candidatus Nitrotoga sp. MKT]